MGALLKWAGAFVLPVMAFIVSSDTVVTAAAAAVVVGLMFALMCSRCLYRPPEQHYAVVFQPGFRNYRIVGVNEWTVIFPLAERLRAVVSGNMAMLKTSHPGVATRDGFPIDVFVSWTYQLNPNLLSYLSVPEYLAHTERNEWPKILQSQVNGVIRAVMIRHRDADLLTGSGQDLLKQELGAKAAAQLRGFGIDLNPGFGVNLQAVRPSQRVRQAMEGRRAAEHEGPGHLEKVRSLADLKESMGLSPADLHGLSAIVNPAAGAGSIVTVLNPDHTGRLFGSAPTPAPQGTGGDDHPTAPLHPRRRSGTSRLS